MPRIFTSVAVACVLWSGLSSQAMAQDEDRGDAERIFRQDVRHVLSREDKSLAIATRRQGNRRVDVKDGVRRATYAIGARVAPASSPVEAARSYLSGVRDEYGLEESGDLELVSVRSTSSSHHVLFQQHVAGLPVYRRFLKVNLDAELQPTMSVNGVAVGLERRDIPRATVSSSAAMDVVRSVVVEGDMRMSEPELMLYPGESLFPVWRILAWPTALPGEWEVLVDATSTKVIQILDRASHKIRVRPGADGSGAAVSSPVPYEIVARVDGSGLAFDPDPLTSSGSPYIPPYTDSGDAPTPQLEAERILVDLPGISLDNEGLYRLDGPYVRVVGGGSISFEPPGESSPDGFTYSRSEPGFEAVCAYYHLDKSQRYVQSLGFVDLQNAPIRVNPRSSAVDNSFYTPGQNFLEFGTGGVDDAEDAGVMWHEYAHALLEAGSPGLSVDGEGQAFHEGWSDYWAGSYMRFLAESETSKRTDWENVFRWDSGDGQIWPGRSLTRSGVYPDNTTCEDPNDSNGDGCVIHSDGLLWATTLMEIYTDVGKTVMDRLALQSHAYLAAPLTFVDAAEAIVQADRDLYGGTHTSAIIQRLSQRGYIDSSTFGPVVSHEPLRSTENLGQTVDVVAQALASSANVENVVVRHRVRGEQTFETLVLSNSQGNEYTGELTLPVLPSTIEYYVEAVDENAIQSRLPANAPVTVFAFDVGPDTEPPSISHIPISSASNALWPVPVVTTVDDNLGVDSVWVDFFIDDKDGVTYESGSFGLILVGNEYRGSFPVAVAELRVGSSVRYSITAQDAAVARNMADAPSSGTYSFPIVFSGVLASFDFELGGGDLQETGVWQRGSPTSVLQLAHSGTGLWGTNLTGPYPDFAQQSSLTLPEFNLDGLASAYLVFWHWYDFEYRGTAGPGVPLEGSIWDGGNVKVSTDDGISWSVVEPERGYSGVVAASATNPLSGEPAFGGYSFGWRREVVSLPPVNGLQIRFDFGTDESNLEQTIGFAGWYIDDLTLVTERPLDQSSPVVVDLPPPVTLRAVGQSLPTIEAVFSDDTGIASVYLDYVVTGSNPESGTLPMAMALDDLNTFAGALPSGVQFQAGDRFEYRLTATDFDGNEIEAPRDGEPSLAIEFRSLAGTNVLRDIVATGHWVRDGSAWTTVAGGESPDPVSSLVLPPVTLAHEVADVWLQLEHSYALGEGMGGNVSFSVNDGRTWTVLEPESGYPGRLSGSHPMNGQDVFSGSSEGPVTTLFDLTEHAGKLLHLRFDFGSTREWQAVERWLISDAFVFASSTEPEIEIPDQLALSSNFPDPFSSTTTIRFTVPEAMHVRIDVLNTLGQLVGLLANGVHEKGTHTATFDGSHLASGLYLIVMDAGDRRMSERMIIVR